MVCENEHRFGGLFSFVRPGNPNPRGFSSIGQTTDGTEAQYLRLAAIDGLLHRRLHQRALVAGKQ